VRILDGRSPWARSGYLDGHIPGAVYVDLTGDLSDPNNPVPMMILPKEPFEALMGKLGIDNKTTVVVYDDEGGTSVAARGVGQAVGRPGHQAWSAGHHLLRRGLLWLL